MPYAVHMHDVLTSSPKGQTSMTIPRHPDQHGDEASFKRPMSTRAKLIIAGVAILVVVMIGLHVAGVALH